MKKIDYVEKIIWFCLTFLSSESDHADPEDQLKEDCDMVKLMLRSKIKFSSGDVVKPFATWK